MVNQEGEEWRKAGRARWVENEEQKGTEGHWKGSLEELLSLG